MTSSTLIPADVDGEKSLLGAMLMSSGARTVAAILNVQPTDFHRAEHAAIFSGIADTIAHGEHVDAGTVALRCNGAGISRQRIAEIQMSCSSSEHAETYAARVLAKSRQRRLMGLAFELTEVARDGGDTGPIVAAITALQTREGRSHLLDGRAFILDAPADLAPVWGGVDQALWQGGESLWIVGPTGVGKTTIEAQLIAASVGILDSVLGFPVAEANRVLVIAADRPRQIAAACRRLFGREHAEILETRVRFWEGPPPRDFGKHPDTLLAMCRDAGADRVFIDSAKDVAVGLSDDEVGGNVNRAIQTATVEGIDACMLHHQRKGREGQRPRNLEDVYGSTWLTAGAGSVVLLWGNAGDPIVELVHLKQPRDPVGPLKVDHDHDTGRSTVSSGPADAFTMLRHAAQGLTARDVARVTTEKADPTDSQVRNALRQLDRLVGKGLAYRTDPVIGGAGGGTPARYYLTVAPAVPNRADL